MIPIIKRCTMNCSYPAGDPRKKENITDDCDDCDVLSERDIDFASVQKLATAMIIKLDQKRDEGRTGWQSASAEDLSRMLIDHVSKGDPIDVANFCMMLHCKGSPVLPTKIPAENAPVGTCVFAENGNVRIWWTARETETAIKWANDHKVELTPLYSSPPTVERELALLRHRINIVFSDPYVCTFQSLAQFTKVAKEFLRGE